MLFIAAGFTLALGAIGILAVAIVTRLELFQQNAHARFALWFSLLASLTIGAGAAAFSGYTWMQSSPTIAVPVARPHARIEISKVVRAIRSPALIRSKQAPAATGRPREFFPVLVDVWLAGTILGLLRLLVGLLRLRAIVSRAETIERRTSARGTVAVLLSDQFTVPIAVGYLRPSIILPRAMVARKDEIDIESVVRHELEHIARFDDITALVQNLCLSALWFNPFAYYIARQINTEREMSCDEAVVSVAGRRKYVATLWTLAQHVSDALVPALASGFSSRSTLARLENLLNRKSATLRCHPEDVFALGTLTMVLLMLCAVIAPATCLALPHIEGATTTMLQDGNILVTGGTTASGATAEAELYDMHRHVFERVGSMHAARTGHTATLLPDGDVLIAGGETARGRYVATTEIYDPKTRRFTRTVDGEGRVGQMALVIDDGNVLMFGGANALNHNCVFIYDTKKAAYKSAGTLVSASAHTLTFRLPNGALVTHSV